MKAGDFTNLAADYAESRPDYSPVVLDSMIAIIQSSTSLNKVADVGAGTGIWTRMLAQAGLQCVGVEPNSSMRQQAVLGSKQYPIEWREGSGENTGLESAGYDWVTMASSFHWTDPAKSLPEFNRILKPNGFLTVIWNPRDLEASPLEQEVEELIIKIVPEIKRVSSGSSKHAKDWGKVIESSGLFSKCLLIEAAHAVAMTPERYLSAWRSVNDIQRQAGPERFAELLKKISERVSTMEKVVVPYKTRGWLARKN